MRISDWSSDVCSSDLRHVPEIKRRLDCVNILAQFTERDISGVVVQDVNAAEMRHGLVHQRLDRCLVCAVETDRDGLAAKFGDKGLGRIDVDVGGNDASRSEEHTSELQSLMRISYAVFC